MMAKFPILLSTKLARRVEIEVFQLPCKMAVTWPHPVRKYFFCSPDLNNCITVSNRNAFKKTDVHS